MPPLAAWARFARLPLPPLRGPPTPACEGGQVQEGEKPVPSPDPDPRSSIPALLSQISLFTIDSL